MVEFLACLGWFDMFSWQRGQERLIPQFRNLESDIQHESVESDNIFPGNGAAFAAAILNALSDDPKD